MVASELHENTTGAECLCSDLQHEDYSPLYEWFNFVVIIIMLPSLSVFGVMTNIINVFIYSRRRMYNSANTYLLFLSFSDFLVIVTGLFIFWVDSARSYIPELAHAPYTTVYTLPIGYMAQTCSIYFTVAAAVDCYIHVCWKNFSSRYCTVKRARQIVTYISLCSVLYNSLRFPQFNLRRCLHEGSQEEIIEICPTALFFTINTIYNVYMYMVLMTLLPFFFLLVLNAFIVVKQSIDGGGGGGKITKIAGSPKSAPPTPCVKKNGNPYFMNSSSVRQVSTASQLCAVPARDCVEMDVYPFGKSICQNHTVDGSPPIRGASAATTSTVTPRRGTKKSKRESLDELIRVAGKRVRRVSMSLSGLHGVSIQTNTSTTDDTITMIMVVVLFLCCNTLALVVNLIETFFEPDALLLNLLSDASNFLVILNSSVNMVIYLIFNSEYRELLLQYCNRARARICACLLKRHKAATRERTIVTRPERLGRDGHVRKLDNNGTLVANAMNGSAMLENCPKHCAELWRRNSAQDEGGNSSATVWLPMPGRQTAAEEIEETPTIKFKSSQSSHHIPSSRSFDPSGDLPLLMVDDDDGEEEVWRGTDDDCESMPTSTTMYESDISNLQGQSSANCIAESLTFPQRYSYIPLLISDGDIPVTSL